MARKRHPRSGKRPQEQQLAVREFDIEVMDNLAQGVAKVDGKVTFVSKTLPGETVKARVLRQKKGVAFGKLVAVEQAADNRVVPDCPHFADCPACDYLHTDYPSELHYKQQALANYLRDITDAESIEVLAAPERLGYRNRLQLHYRHKHIGMVDGLTDKVLPIPQCKIFHPALQTAFDALYDNSDWTKDKSVAGHCELYLKDDSVSVRWDEEYAHGGFTQVNTDMNQVLCDTVTDYLSTLEMHSLLDLFSGTGNLSDAALLNSKNNSTEQDQPLVRQMVDYTPCEADDFIALDLFDDDALRRFGRKSVQKHFDVMLVDPPRKGFPALNDWIKRTKPKHLVYVSCNAATQARDIKSIEQAYSVKKVAMLDLFPATSHFESLVCLEF